MKYERLTERSGKAIVIKQTSTNDSKSIWNAIERLAELEDKIECGEFVSKDWHDEQVLHAENRLAELEDKLENGTLIELPCKVGDTVWFIPLYGGNPYCGIRQDKIQVVGISSRGFHLKLREHHDHNKTYYLGKTVFLTKAEAEKKLKELKGEV